MALETGNKLNNLLSEGTPNGLYFSEWLGARMGTHRNCYSNTGSANMTMDQGSTINPEQW